LFDVGDGPVYVARSAQVMIEGLILPKRLPGSAQYLIRTSGRRSLQPPHQPWHRNQREDQQVYVVRHHDPSAEFVEAPLVGSAQDGVRDQIANPPVFEP